MKPPYITIVQDGRSDSYRLDPEYDGLISIKTRLFEYSVTNDREKLPSGVFMLVSLPTDIRTRIVKTHRNGPSIRIDIFIDENWKFSIGMRTNDYQWYFCGQQLAL